MISLAFLLFLSPDPEVQEDRTCQQQQDVTGQDPVTIIGELVMIQEEVKKPGKIKQGGGKKEPPCQDQDKSHVQ